jgi:hypothetical protein
MSSTPPAMTVYTLRDEMGKNYFYNLLWIYIVKVVFGPRRSA